MKVAYFDCFHGAAGDMLLAALLDAGLERAALEAVLAALPLSGYTLEHWAAHSHHLRGSRLAVRVHAPQPPRAWADLRQMLRDSPLPEHTRRMASATFERLARAEAGVHGVPLDDVHFHEVGAVDSIVDTVGVCAALDLLGVERVYASALPLGQGWVTTQHGPLPVPAPATLALLAEVGAPLVPPPDLAASGELLTPTAAALLCELATFGQPAMRVQQVGYGLGSREYARPNGLRVWLGEQEPAGAPAPADAASEQVYELRCNLDDATGELLAYTIERLLAAGALDAWATPLVMKKGRPATQLACLARPTDAAALAALMLRETPTLGVRWESMQRLAAAREVVSVATPWGAVRLVRKLLDGEIVGCAPEYEDCAALARTHQVPLAQVYAAALQAAAQG
jgi:uncharacterized protein (TIGR00299 family) protein